MKVVFKDEHGRTDAVFSMNGSAHLGDSGTVITEMLDNCGCEYGQGKFSAPSKYVRKNRKPTEREVEENLLREVYTKYTGLGIISRYNRLVSHKDLKDAYLAIVDIDDSAPTYPGVVSIYKDNKIEAFYDVDNVEYFESLSSKVVPDAIHIIYKTEAEAVGRLEKLAYSDYIDTRDAMATIREYVDCSGNKVAEFWLNSKYASDEKEN